MKQRVLLILLIAAIALSIAACGCGEKSIYGAWKLNLEKSTDIQTWRYRKLTTVISAEKDGLVSVNNIWRNKGKGEGAGSWIDSVAFKPGGDPVEFMVDSQIWQENWYMGVLSKKDVARTVSGSWVKEGRELKTVIEQIVEVSQGDATVKTDRHYKLNWCGDELTVTEQRSTRPTPVVLVYDKVETTK